MGTDSGEVPPDEGWEMVDNDVPKIQKLTRGFTIQTCGINVFKGHWEQVSETNHHARYTLESDPNSVVDWDPQSATWRMHLGTEVMYSSSLASNDVPLEGWTFTHEYSPPEITLAEHLPIKVHACSMEEANGQWEYHSQIAGRPKYGNGHGEITWSEERKEWQMHFSGKDTVHRSLENWPSVPATGWEHFKGP